MGQTGLADMRGVDSYAGHKVHGPDWRSYDFTGMRVGVIDAGTGAIAIVPELVKRAEFVKLFQRAPSWVLPQQVFAGVPALGRQLARVHLRLMVKDPWLRRQLTPSPVQDCRHILVSADYYPALQRDNCKLIDWPIATLSPAGIRTSDGVEHHLDAIVFAD